MIFAASCNIMKDNTLYQSVILNLASIQFQTRYSFGLVSDIIMAKSHVVVCLT